MKLINRLRVLLCTMLISLSAYGFNPAFDTMVIFGDSLSDNGNLYRYFLHFLPVSPPYYEGHFSNGPLWAEYLYQNYFPSDYSIGFQNYAVGGAGAVLSYKENLPFTLSVELNDYLYWNTYGHKDTSLYTIWIGANNYVNGPSNVEALTDSVVDAIGNAAERLIGKGGNKFLIINLPDLAKLPQSKKISDPSLLTRLTLAHNQKLQQRVDSLRNQYPDALFLYFDAYSFFNESITHPADYGIHNIEDPCYLGSYSGWLTALTPSRNTLYTYLKQQNPGLSEAQWSIIQANPALHEAAETAYIYSKLPQAAKDEALYCDNYLFWDHVHPTTVVHRLIAEQISKLIEEAGLEANWPESISQKVSNGRDKQITEKT
ncbi:lysophospholipase A [Legionella birminghamensis]|uniref:Lysophospholipase A n=1 Tax=Legionella birminghamensis TaxID=28083 RepID=A0A378I512_9GAMM|nr:SGNH/GDSL hydrolase family protein [Legionella birminghamensis]KTC68727.1 lysophospholipase A [Legionella birminghamensis]STX30287.1 lysophospholipase A [Legionella birminghamensis]